MQISVSEKQVEKFQAIYLEEYGREIDKAQARTELTSLVCYLEAVYKHINKINYE